jgi:hypothetical protein
MAGIKKTRKGSPSTLTGFWNTLNKIAPLYLEKFPVVKKKMKDEMNAFIDEVNLSPIPGLIYESFIHPYFKEKTMTVVFSGDEKGVFGNFCTKIDVMENIVKIDPVGLYKFSTEIAESEEKLKGIDKDEDYLKCRLYSFRKEILKLPGQYLLFLAVLKEVVIDGKIYAVDSRGAFANEESSEYFSLLWALKQFEEFYLKVQIRNIRSDFALIWHEGDWIDAGK